MIEREKSEFNEAITKLGRINIFICEMSIARDDPMDFSKWIGNLFNLFLELSNKMKKDERIEKRELLFNLKDQINKLNNKHGQQKSIPKDLYRELILFEEGLREVMKEAGMDDRLLGADGGIL